MNDTASFRAALALTVAGGFAAAGLAGAAPASANKWDPHVILNGTIQCPAYGGPYDKVQWMWVEGNKGDRGWASRSGGYKQKYTFELWKVPANSPEHVTISYGCSASGRHQTSFGVNRPASGIYATRNIY